MAWNPNKLMRCLFVKLFIGTGHAAKLDQFSERLTPTPTPQNGHGNDVHAFHTIWPLNLQPTCIYSTISKTISWKWGGVDLVTPSFPKAYNFEHSEFTLLSAMVIVVKMVILVVTAAMVMIIIVVMVVMHTCKKRVIPVIYHRNFFWIFRKILGWERKINTAPKPSPEVAPSKMEVAPS